MDPLVNLFYTELTGLPYSDTDTSFTLTAGSVADLPDADTEGAYNLVIWDRQYGSPGQAKRDGGVFEIVRVTADDAGTDTITVTRAQEGTTAQSYTSGKVYGVIQAATKKVFDDLAPLTDANFTNMPSVAGDAIVAQGSNTDGSWVKFADGTMICSITKDFAPDITQSFGNIFRSQNFYGNYPFPQTFTRLDSISDSIGARNLGQVWGASIDKADESVSQTANYTLMSPISNSPPCRIRTIAIGMWK